MENNIDFNRFDEIDHLPLRTFNRSVMAFNILEDFGPHVLEEYLNLFSKKEKIAMFAIYNYIKNYGLDQTKKIVLKGLELPEDENVSQAI